MLGVSTLFFLVLPARVTAYPPAPHHTLYGMVRNQWGDPIDFFSSAVFLETPAGTTLQSSLVDGLEPGVNYRLDVPMDAGTTADLYQPTAMRPFFLFRLQVRVGQVTYLPIEMSGDFSEIGQPARQTRIDLTLGADSDGDGLPDAWEEAIIALFGGTLADINPDDDTDGDGISNLNEYLAGTYAFDPSDGFRLSVASVNAGDSILEFLAIRGRTYAIESSLDLRQWTAVRFRVVTGGIAGNLLDDYLATDVRLLRVQVPLEIGAETNRYFRAIVQ